MVRATRVDTRDAADPSATYAETLSASLKSAGVAHKVVTYEFRYRTRLREEAIGTRTAVLYRDENDPRNPWWLMDDRLSKPLWLPGENLEYQLAYYIHRPATVVSVDGFKASGEGKKLAGTRPEERSNFLARLFPARKDTGSRLQVRREAPRVAVTADAENAPGEITPRALALFRARHGTEFDRASVMDRVKMEHLLRAHRQFVERWSAPKHREAVTRVRRS